jgi:hypothetical protein
MLLEVGMPDELEIRVGGVGLLLTRADAASVAAQLAEAGIAAESVLPNGALIIGDDHPMWSLHSGGSRHDAPDWGPGDEQLAESQYRLPPLTGRFHNALVAHPGQLLSVEQLAGLSDGELSNSRVIAGALAGYVQWCERLNRRFPFYWWEGRNGESTTYAMQPRVASLFLAASSPAPRREDQPVWATREQGAFWAYENWVADGHRATIHRGECRFCNYGAGVHGGGQTRNGRWLGPFSSTSGATAEADRAGAKVRDCSRCLP